MKHFATLSLALLAGALAVAPTSAQVLNEIRVDHPGTDVDEYVEIAGTPGASLAGLWLVVIGDGTGGCGVVEASIPLGAYSIQADGFFALRYSSGTPALTGYDQTLSGSFENSDNLTFLLVSGNAPPAGADIDTNNDGTLDSTPWTSIVDQVGIYEGIAADCVNDEFLYTTTVVGPDGTFSPGHIFRCGADWRIGPFGSGTWPAGATDTPGAANSCPTPVERSTWGQVKTLYR